jgi:predicted PurR-regulated permease PerM
VTHDDPRALIGYALVGLALTVAVSWGPFLVRDALLFLCVASIVAIGLSPIVGVLERRARPWSRQRLPRWAAILAVPTAAILQVAFQELVVEPVAE